jgi:hypothetical protein
MKIGLRVQLTENFDQVAEAHLAGLMDALTETAFEAEAYAKIESAVDTGAQRASVFVVTPTSSNYSQAASDAEALQSGVEIFPEPAKPASREVLLAVGVNYAYWNEVLGKPFLGPAMDRSFPSLEEKARKTVGSQLARVVRIK